jgi:ppGpp synthetase/RelA/SpoT-type nucleotidyltranferase
MAKAVMMGNAIKGRMNRAKRSYSRIGANNVFVHAIDTLKEGILGGVVHPKAKSQNDPMSIKVTDLILYHVFNRGQIPKDIRKSCGEAHDLFDTMRHLLVQPNGDKQLDALLTDDSIPINIRAQALFAHLADIATAEKESITLAMPEGTIENQAGERYFPHYPDWASMLPILARNTDKVILPFDDYYGFGYFYQAHRDFASKYLYGDDCIYGNMFLRAQNEATALRPQIMRTNQVVEEAINHLSAFCKRKNVVFDVIRRTIKSVGSMARKLYKYTRKEEKKFIENCEHMSLQVPANLSEKMSDRLHVRDLHDVVAREIIVNNKKDLWQVINSLHTVLEQVSKKHGMDISIEVEDFVSNPKSNGYQAYHFDIKVGNEEYVNFEFRIVTKNMKRRNDKGDAAHHLYKGGSLSNGTNDEFKEIVEERRKKNGLGTR